jgi:hypothetical protein
MRYIKRWTMNNKGLGMEWAIEKLQSNYSSARNHSEKHEKTARMVCQITI